MEFWLEHLDRYCERTGPEFWSEPLNAASNLAFLIVGYHIVGIGQYDDHLKVFGKLVFLVGIGSAMFHTFGTRWAMVADVVPIGICLIWYLWAYLRHAAQYSVKTTATLLVLFGTASGGLAAWKLPDWVNETHQYLGALVALALLAWKRPEARAPFTAATVTFGLSMTLRTLDPLVCDAWPAGTHFLWHTLNGVAFYFAARAYVASAFRTAATPRGT